MLPLARLGVCLVTMASWGVLASEAYGAYPTTWKIDNGAQAVWLQCEGTALGLPLPIDLHMQLAEGSNTYTWTGWHNDGMGLNNAKWVCAAGPRQGPLAGGREKHYFATAWGENITLKIYERGGRLLIAKSS